MKILVLGIGNILFGDEGIGVHLSNLLKVNYRFEGPHQVDVIDGGTLAQLLIPLITSYDYVIVIDCVDAGGGKIGEVYFFDFDNVPNVITWQGSAHEVEMLQTLRMTEVNGDLPPVKIVGVIPSIIGSETAFDLSKEVAEASVTMEKIVLNHLQELGVEITRIDSKTIDEIAPLSYKGF
ncbi:HyaD/HybD family hydrogenase maturation endopeptidase [Wolinella succinogenes]|uniref:HyaD/HybD family hydrogenase maturation endopeptidase n=1 Tax=Wolinella succinogenes TaxID=844 RepID=UPI00001C0137|nr:HyaD/HybD family hydrogenase maturation endopeptidase [Wolinella succinogenes]NLU34637.1 HyaD/HybD family hydrogenase maturation endopeptidase [Wolinella succinogenes]CAE10711.1 HYDROGENASE EXPRESSION/FORMATION PROTEIN [Wolinella succinogenes]HCZ18615.1 HyaD/HybD family hydrogenase maturation endopeptidase [Helicobacter sp.]